MMSEEGKTETPVGADPSGSQGFKLDVSKLGLEAAPDLSENTSSLVDNVKPEDIMLGFRHLSISTANPPKQVLADVSGFVVKGGITAIMGGSSAGKSLIMKYITGRLPHMRGTGEILFQGKAFDPNHRQSGFGFVPQEDFLIGDLTVRETFEIALALRKDEPLEDRKKAAENIIQSLGLGRVGDNLVGPLMRRSLSGGEKRRTSVGNELVCQPMVLFLDEPTSGLDGAAAFEVIKTIRDLTVHSGGAFSVLLSIHQPNTRILSLFDHILLLGNGGSTFFGCVKEALDHFRGIGHEIPENENPTDHILQVTDTSFNSEQIIPTDYCQEYATSATCKKVVRKLAECRAIKAAEWDADDDDLGHQTSFWMQYSTLTKREAILAVRDPSLYYLQCALHVLYGFFIGVTFWDVQPVLNDTVQYLPGAILWTTMLCSYVHVFKIFYMVNANRRYEHERANGSYSAFAFWLSELTVTFLSQAVFVPGPLIAFYCIGLPSVTYPFYLLTLVATGMCAESMLNFISKFTENAAVAIVASQAILVMLTVFGGGVFLPLNDIPGYWNWLAELAVFKQATSALMLRIFEDYDYVCPDTFIAGDTCNNGLYSFDCSGENSDAAAGVCEVKGVDVIDVVNGVSGDYWAYFGYLVLLFVAFRTLILFLYYYPVKKLTKSIKMKFASYTQFAVLELQMEVQRLRGEVNALNSAASKQGTIALRPHDENYDDEVLNEDLTRSGAVDSTDIEGGERVPLKRVNSSFDSRPPVFLRFEDVLVTLPKNGKVLIDKVSGYAESGKVLALMGPSGAGKTTLLNALSGRATYAKVDGKIKLGTRPMTTNDLDYVPQFDYLNEGFTIYETLMYMAKLRTLGRARRRVLELISILGLTSKSHLPIADLSGGEKKRVSIGMGLITQPPALFLDEPTTGLDSAAAYGVVRYITSVAAHTHTCVIMTIHQPSSSVFELCENLMLLEQGRLSYFGKRAEAMKYFASLGALVPPRTNPADVYADLIYTPPPLANGSTGTWKDLYMASDFVQAMPTCVADGVSCREADVVERPRPLSVFRTLTWQLTVGYWRDFTVYWLRFFELLFIAIYVGTIFIRLDNTVENVGKFAGAAFFNTWCVLFAVIAATPAFVVERSIALNEMLNGAYSPAFYCGAQYVASLGYNFIISLLFQAVFHFLVGFKDTFESYFYASMLTFALLLMMEGLMLIVVEVIKNDMLSTTLSMVVLGILFLFPGFFIKTDDIVPAVRWVSYMMPTRYAFQGQLYNIFHDQTYSGVPGDTVLDLYFDVPSDLSKWGMWAVVFVGYTFFFRLCHYAAVYFTIYPYLKSSRISAGEQKVLPAGGPV